MPRILAASSTGGHWTQLNLLRESFDSDDTLYLTTAGNPAVAILPKHRKVVFVCDANFTQKRRMLLQSLQVIIQVMKFKPEIVISTGASAGFFSIVFGKLIGAKTIWVDSIANHNGLSLAGRYVHKYCDVMLTQWPHLSKEGIADYSGRVL